MLDPNATNAVTCLSCKWTRIIDHLRPYRGGHTNPATEAECHEPLLYVQLDPRAPEVAVLGEDKPIATIAELNTLEPADQLAELLRRDAVLPKLDELYRDPARAAELLAAHAGHTLTP